MLGGWLQDVASKAQSVTEGAKSATRQAGNKAQSGVQSGGGDVKKVAQQGNLNFISLLQLPSPQVCARALPPQAPHVCNQRQQKHPPQPKQQKCAITDNKQLLLPANAVQDTLLHS